MEGVPDLRRRTGQALDRARSAARHEAPESGPTDPGPGSATEVLAAREPLSSGAAPADGGDESSGAGIWLGLIAIVISALAAVGTGLLWSTRPARLPEEDDER